MGKLCTGVQNTRNRDHTTACTSHTSRQTMYSGRSATAIAMYVAKQPLDIAIKLTRPYPLTLGMLLPKALPLTLGRTRYNWTLHLKPLFLHTIFPDNNGNQSWISSRETRGPGRWWAQWLLAILYAIPSPWFLKIGLVPTCYILFTRAFSFELLDSNHLLRCPTVL